MSVVPSVERLERGLRTLTTGAGTELADARVVRRRPNRHMSSFPSELVDVQTAQGAQVLFCKHGADYVDRTAALRRGPGYEAEVYTIAGGVLGGDAPRPYGSFRDGNVTTLVVGYVAAAKRLDKTHDGDAVVEAARRLGRLHRRGRTIAGHSPRLNAYGRTHYSLRLGRPLVRNGDSLDEARSTLVSHRSLLIELLVNAERTLVHGELFTANVLVGHVPVFVDWETAGVGAGEVDLAALTVGAWPERTREACESAYADVASSSRPGTAGS